MFSGKCLCYGQLKDISSKTLYTFHENWSNKRQNFLLGPCSKKNSLTWPIKTRSETLSLNFDFKICKAHLPSPRKELCSAPNLHSLNLTCPLSVWTSTEGQMAGKLWPGEELDQKENCASSSYGCDGINWRVQVLPPLKRLFTGPPLPNSAFRFAVGRGYSI